MTFFCYVVVRCVALVLVVLSGCLLLDFPNVYHAKTSSFCSFSDKNFATDPQIAQSQNTKSMVFATLSPKCYQKTRTKNMGKRKPRNVVLFTKTSPNTGFSCFFTKIPPKHKRRTPRGGRRTCYLVVGVGVGVGCWLFVVCCLLLLSLLLLLVMFTAALEVVRCESPLCSAAVLSRKIPRAVTRFIQRTGWTRTVRVVSATCAFSGR